MGLSSTHPPRTFDPYLLTHKALTLSCSHSIVIIIYTIQTDFITRRHTLSNTRWLAHEYMILTMQDNLTDRGILVGRGWTSKPTNQREKHMLITSSKTSSKWSNKFDSLLTHNWPQPRTPIATHAHTRIYPIPKAEGTYRRRLIGMCRPHSHHGRDSRCGNAACMSIIRIFRKKHTRPPWLYSYIGRGLSNSSFPLLHQDINNGQKRVCGRRQVVVLEGRDRAIAVFPAGC